MLQPVVHAVYMQRSSSTGVEEGSRQGSVSLGLGCSLFLSAVDANLTLLQKRTWCRSAPRRPHSNGYVREIECTDIPTAVGAFFSLEHDEDAMQERLKLARHSAAPSLASSEPPQVPAGFLSPQILSSPPLSFLHSFLFSPLLFFSL